MTLDLLLEAPDVVRVIGRGALDREFTAESEEELQASVTHFVIGIGKSGAFIRRIGFLTLGQARALPLGKLPPKNIFLYRTWQPWGEQ